VSANLAWRIEKRGPAYHSSGTLVSAVLDNIEENIISVIVSWNESKPEGTDITVQVTNNNGSNWEDVENGDDHTFASTGSSLRYRVTLTTSNNTVTPVLYDITLTMTWVSNDPPNKPTNLLPSTRQTSTSVPRSAFVTDNNGDRMNVSFYDNATKSLIDNVWADSGTTASVVWAGRVRGQTYKFFVRAQDNNGAWGENSSVQSFKVNSLPIAENQKAENRVNPENLTTSTPTLSWNFFDNDGDGQTQRQIQVGTSENDNSMWDSTVSTSAKSATYAGSALSIGVTYRWRVRVFDNYEWSSWLYGGTFKYIGQHSTLEADIKITPTTMYVPSKGNWANCSIELPSGFDVADIIVSSIRLENSVPAEDAHIAGKKLEVKFDRDILDTLLHVGDNVKLTVTGDMVNGDNFRGSAFVDVKENKKPPKGLGWVVYLIRLF
jgi:hypothetical protein